MSLDIVVILFGCAGLIFGALQTALYRRIETLEAEVTKLKTLPKMPEQKYRW
jgi:hypothetical protein